MVHLKGGSRPPWVGLGAAVWLQIASGNAYNFHGPVLIQELTTTLAIHDCVSWFMDTKAQLVTTSPPTTRRHDHLHSPKAPLNRPATTSSTQSNAHPYEALDAPRDVVWSIAPPLCHRPPLPAFTFKPGRTTRRTLLMASSLFLSIYLTLMMMNQYLRSRGTLYPLTSQSYQGNVSTYVPTRQSQQATYTDYVYQHPMRYPNSGILSTRQLKYETCMDQKLSRNKRSGAAEASSKGFVSTNDLTPASSLGNCKENIGEFLHPPHWGISLSH